MSKVELTNMVMVQNKATGEVLIQDRIKSWCGWSFPGGHVEKGESFVDSAIREVKEETGLDIKNLQSCGVVHWANTKTGDRYIVFLYKTTDYTGELIEDGEEGKQFFASVEEFKNHKSDNNAARYLPIFLQNEYSEAFGPWENQGDDQIFYK